jgi:hypothetical protein
MRLGSFAKLASSLTLAGGLLAGQALPFTALAAPEAAVQPAPETPRLTAGNRIAWQGGERYLQGINVAWLNWGCDFGCGANGGVSSPASQATLGPAFNQLKNDGVHVARWWVFEGDAWQITRDANGAPAAISPAVYTDLDAAMKLAEEYDLYYNLVLFSGAANTIPTSWMTDDGQRAKLASVLAPLFARYGSNPRIMAWEIFNEPEWDIWNGKITEAPVKATVREIAGAVHANSNAYVTVGSAILDGLPMWLGQGLDFYQAHWYDPMSSGQWCARCTDYASVRTRYNLDAPVVIGELYAGTDVDAQQRFSDFYNKGFAGAWAWSLFPEKTHDKLGVDMAAARQFIAQQNASGASAIFSMKLPS